jgi:hypothetical protein
MDGLTRSDKFRGELLKGDLTRAIVEANLKLVEHSRAAEEVKTDSQAFRKTNRSGDLTGSQLDRNIVNKARNIAAVANDDHLSPAALPVDPHISGFSGADHAEGGSRIHVNPDFVILDRDRDDRHQVAFVQRVRELDNRHTISSSLGTLSTDGIFSGSTSRALVSTSRRESPTATSVSFTMATYFPAYLVTSSLKCSTIQRSSRSMFISLCTKEPSLSVTIGCRAFSSQGTRLWGVGGSASD